jgi:N-glycosylase/DNA lyase
MPRLPKELREKYIELKAPIRQRLEEFKAVPEEKYFYELCYCVCTPQSKAQNALTVQKKLEKKDFFHRDFNPTDILRNPEHYIRFHNQKAERLQNAKKLFPDISKVIKSDITAHEKRDWLAENFKGFGMKESSHFLRNIGFEGLAILDRHILSHLVLCGVIPEMPKSINAKRYRQIEKLCIEFSQSISIPVDELDLLFWSSVTGVILK